MSTTVPANRKVVFVYNADTGYFNMVADMAHKIFSPATYPCSLCDLTYGIFKIRPEWDAFVKDAPIPFVFLHKDEFHAQFPALSDFALPSVLLQEGDGKMKEIIPASRLMEMKNLEELKTSVLRSL